MQPSSLGHALKRGTFHAALGLAIAAALLLCPRLVVLSALAAATAAFLCLEVVRLRLPFVNQLFYAIFAPFLRQEEENRLTGSSYFLIGCLATALIFPTPIAFLAIIFLSLGDPTATIVGVWQGHFRLWNKTVEGTIACLLVCLAAGILTAVLAETLPLSVTLLGAVTATLFQALPLRLDDNITIPLTSATAMLILGSLI